MFIDFPPNMSNETPVIVLAQSQQARQSSDTPRVLGTCRVTINNPEGEFGGGIPLAFSGEAVNYLFDFGGTRVNESNAKVTLLQGPEHGRLGYEWKGALTYTPVTDYYGKDKIVALVDIDGYQVTVVYFINVTRDGIQEDDESILKYCGPKGVRWKISLLPSQETDDFASWLRSTSLSTLLTGAVE
jgi:hypothetical protein